MSLPSLRPFVPLWPQSSLARFDGVRDEKISSVLHEIVEKYKGLEFSFEGFRPLPLVDTEDAKVSPLHVIFELKGVFVGKE